MSQSIHFNRILFPTDFAHTSSNAQRYVIALAQQLGASVHLLHAIEPIETGADEQDDELRDFYQRLEARANHQLERLMAEFKEAGVPASWEVVIGRRWASIIKRAEELKSSLIVMGTHGIRVQDGEVTVGATSHRVPYVAPCPVLLVRDDTALPILETIHAEVTATGSGGEPQR